MILCIADLHAIKYLADFEQKCYLEVPNVTPGIRPSGKMSIIIHGDDR